MALYRVVEHYSGDPDNCLVEDDDGIRILIWSSPDISAKDWVSAHRNGVSAIYNPITNAWLFVEQFMDQRQETTTGYVMPPLARWQVLSDPQEKLPSYRAMKQQLVSVAKSPRGFVHLHAHSEFSALDGLASVKEMVSAAKADGNPALAITDHGKCASHPHLQAECDKAGIKPIFGIEAYFVNDRFERPKPKDQYETLEEFNAETSRIRKYNHLILWAMDDEGLRNLWAMSTEANREGQYYYPRMDWDTLARFNKGVMCSTACLNGPLSDDLLQGREDAAINKLARLSAIFGDRLYLELHTNQLPQQIELNQKLVKLGEKHGVQTVAVVDSHYACEEDQDTHRVWLSSQLNKDLTEDTYLFAGDSDYHMQTEAEVRKSLAYLDDEAVEQAVSNTVCIAERCTARIAGKATPPVFSKKPTTQESIDHDVARVIDACIARWPQKVVGKARSQQEYMARFEREMKLLTDKKFCGYFLMVADYCKWSRDHGILVGPGRGSGGGSLVAYLLDIVEIDPVDADLLFERFLTDGRTSLPDFDVDFPASKRKELEQYVRIKYGEDHVVRVGTHIRLKNKGAVRDLARVLKSTIEIDYRDIDAISKIIDEAESDKAGLGMSWDDLWTEQGDQLQPYKDKYPLLFKYADNIVGRLKSYGKHAAGVVISAEEPLIDRLPLRGGEDGEMIAEFDMEALELLGLVKFDLLTLRTLDTIQMCVDLIEEQTGDRIDVYSWKDEYFDPLVWEQLSVGRTLGVFQIETGTGTRMTKDFKPESVHDLAAVMTLVRPGPMRSGLTATYMRRRKGEESVSFPDNRLETVLAKTYGCLVYQEDIMQTTMVLAGYDSNEADFVRKILGKKKIEAVVDAGQKFVARCVENGGDEHRAEALWEQMAEFAKYCVAGDTQVHLAASGPNSDGTITAEFLYRRINTPLLPAVIGKPKKGDEYAGPCVVCGAEDSPKWQRGACQACYVWRQKFRDVNRGLYGLTVEADGRIRPCRVLMVHQHLPEKVWTVTLANGRSITATANHCHLTPEGLRRVDELAIGDHLTVDGGYERHQYLDGEQRTTRGERLLAGSVNGAVGDENYGFVDGGFTSLMAWTAQAPSECQECGHDGSERRLERAHLDGDHANNDWSNLAMLCVGCHKRHDYAFNGRRRRWGKGRLTSSSEIVSIELRGTEPTYSVVMDDPHIWIGNGIATSNSFNQAHAYGYAVLGYWCAWLKVHYPLQFLAAALSTVDDKRYPEFINDARRMGYRVLPPDINESGRGFKVVDGGVRYGLDSVKGIGQKAVSALVDRQPFVSWEDFQSRGVGGPVNTGVVKTLARVGAFDQLYPHRRELEVKLDWDGSNEAKLCVHTDVNALGPNGLPCGFDWASEPVELLKSGKPKKQKPLPKRCSRVCRQYAAPILDSSMEHYTEVEIRDREMELLSVHLSSTPFDRLGPIADQLVAVEDIDDKDYGSKFDIAGIVTKIKPWSGRNGEMAFTSFQVMTEEVDVTLFKDEWAKYRQDLRLGRLYLATVKKNDRGLILMALWPI